MKFGHIHEHQPNDTVKFRILFSFCSQIKWWFSGLEFTNFFSGKANREDSGMVLNGCFPVCLGIFGRQLGFAIGEHLPKHCLNQWKTNQQLGHQLEIQSAKFLFINTTGKFPYFKL